VKILEIYKMVEGSNVWNFTSGNAPDTFNGDTYTPTDVGRSQVEIKNELAKANIELSFGLDNTIARRYINSIIDNVVTLTVWSKQDATYNVVWKGRLSGVKPQEKVIKLIFESIFTSLRRPGLRLRYQRTCPHTLYGRGCNLNKDDFGVAGTAASVSGNNVTVSTASAQIYVGGMLKAPDGTLRFIVAQSGTTLQLIRPIPGLVNGNAVVVYPGCDRSRDVCNSRFNNLPNNGSFPFIPQRNPFTGNSFT
jgi:uncharacterized phage protein (TIGR02218 family)